MGRTMAFGRGTGNGERRHDLARAHGALHRAEPEFLNLPQGKACEKGD